MKLLWGLREFREVEAKYRWEVRRGEWEKSNSGIRWCFWVALPPLRCSNLWQKRVLEKEIVCRLEWRNKRSESETFLIPFPLTILGLQTPSPKGFYSIHPHCIELDWSGILVGLASRPTCFCFLTLWSGLVPLIQTHLLVLIEFLLIIYLINWFFLPY